MKVLVIGGGGREHALVYKLSRSSRVDRIYCAPGNAGIAELAECVDCGQEDLDGLLRVAKELAVDLTVVGPEAPLCLGIVDRFEEAGLRVFGPRRNAAELEGSKAFAKSFMIRHLIPTAGYRAFRSVEDARYYVSERELFPVVIKASGLAAGKGVAICKDLAEAEQFIESCIHGQLFGEAGSEILIEEFLKGEEASILAFVDGHTIAILESSQDHKAAFDGDTGPNTGGMGAYSPAPVVTNSVHREIEQQILIPLVDGLNREERSYRGLIYVGLMIAGTGVKALEFNVRFGDPEAQPLMMRLRTDLVDVLEAVIDGQLDQMEFDWDPRPAVSIVMAAKGYPGNVVKGTPIYGVEKVPVSEDLQVFHAGTSRAGGQLVTSGGRVLSVTALGDTLQDAKLRAEEAVKMIEFEGSHTRTDIADKGIRRLS